MAGQRTPTMKRSVSCRTSVQRCVRLELICVCLVLPAKAQKVEMDKLEKAKKERTKVSLMTKQDHSAVCFVLSVRQRQVSTSRTVFLLSITHAAKFRSSLEQLHRAATDLRVFIRSESVLLIQQLMLLLHTF